MPTKQFSKLKKIWDKKLKDSGFQDIEGDHDIVITSGVLSARRFFERNTYDSFRNKERYYQLAGHFLHEHNFQTYLDKEIWRLHSEGLSYRDISEQIKVLKKTQICKVVKTLKEQMLKKYIGANSEQE